MEVNGSEQLDKRPNLKLHEYQLKLHRLDKYSWVFVTSIWQTHNTSWLELRPERRGRLLCSSGLRKEAAVPFHGVSRASLRKAVRAWRLTLELSERFSQHPQLFALLLHILLRHQTVVHRRIPLQLLHRLLQVTAENHTSQSDSHKPQTWFQSRNLHLTALSSHCESPRTSLWIVLFV